MKNKYLRIIALFSFIFSSLLVNAQEVGLTFEKKVHDFGTFSTDSGEKKCTFEFKNNTSKPIVINNILSSCGCTTPKWPKKPVMPGEKGVIDVVYDNNLGPYPFDKSLTVYTSASSKPVMLRITGVPVEGKKTLSQQFPVKIGPFGLKNNRIPAGQFEQGDEKTKSFIIANTSNRKVVFSFKDLSKGLSFSKPSYDIEPNGVLTVDYTINTKEQQNWGNTEYKASIAYNNQTLFPSIIITSSIIERYSNITAREKANSSMLTARNSSINVGNVPFEQPVKAVFDLINTGKTDLIIYKAETEGSSAKISYPEKIAPGQEFKLTADINTKNIQKGKELVCTITLVTNSPNRPLVNLFVIGKIA